MCVVFIESSGVRSGRPANKEEFHVTPEASVTHELIGNIHQRPINEARRAPSARVPLRSVVNDG